jgi:DNA-binding CsgD family transcriptional regulator/tetratricopeptide (TPR) repeat protein
LVDDGAVHQRDARRTFVGRTEELAALAAALDAAGSGDGNTVLITGDAGIGKSRLVEEFCESARSSDAIVATGCCVPVGGSGLPYAPVVGLLRDLVRQVGEEALASVFTASTTAAASGADVSWSQYSAVPHVTDELAKTKNYEALLAYATRISEQAPCVFVFEDLHWADAASTEVIGFLARNLGSARVLLLCTYRSDEHELGHQLIGWASELSRAPRVTTLPINPLQREEVSAMIESLVGEPPGWALIDAVYGRSQGNPFFVEELTAARGDHALPLHLQSLVISRLQGLSIEARDLVRVASVVGAPVSHELLVEIDVLEPPELDDALDELIRRQLLIVDATGTGYALRHALLREVIYASMLPGERARWHHRVASALESMPLDERDARGHRAAEVAAHWWAAGVWDASLAPSIAAADAAVAVWAFPEALVHFERALAAAGRLGDEAIDPLTRASLLEQAADTAYMAGANDRSVELAREAIPAAERVLDPLRVARCWALLGRNAWSVGDSDLAFEAYRRAAALVPTDVPSTALARVMAEEARGLMLMSRFGAAERRCREALPIAEAAGARAEEGHLKYTLGCSRGLQGFLDEGIQLVRDALVIAEETANADDLNRAYMGLTALLAEAGRLEECVAVIFDSTAVGEDLWGVRLNGAATNVIDSLLRLGRHAEAEALLTSAREVGVGSCVTGPSLLRAQVALRDGRTGDASRFLALSDELSSNLDDLQVRGTYHLLRAEIALLEERPADADIDIEQALALSAETDDAPFLLEMNALAIRCLADQFEALTDARDVLDVDKLRLRGRDRLQAIEDIVAARIESGAVVTPRLDALAATARAELSRLHQSSADAWEIAAASWERCGEPYPTAYSLWRAADALLSARSQRPRATECLQRAWLIGNELSSTPLVEDISRLAQRARVHLSDAPDEPPTPESMVAADLGLTPREVEVLGHLAAGHSDRDIAESLFISKKTASVHVSNLLRKLDVPNRVEAGRVGQAHNLRPSLPHSDS